MSDLTGKVAIVTGAARGQGAAIAHTLAARGATVVAADLCKDITSIPYPLSAVGDLNEVVDSIVGNNGYAEAAVLDVRDRAAVHDLVERVARTHGTVDIVVAAAGVCAFSGFDDISADLWTDTLETNLSGVFHLVQASVAHMRKAGYGRIIAISSGAGRMGIHNLAHYAASKWGLIGLVKSVALEVAGTGITANVISPTAVGTPMVLNDNALARHFPGQPGATLDDLREKFRSENPMGIEWLEPKDIVRAAEWLIDDRGVMSGTVIEVNLATSAARP